MLINISDLIPVCMRRTPRGATMTYKKISVLAMLTILLMGVFAIAVAAQASAGANATTNTTVKVSGRQPLMADRQAIQQARRDVVDIRATAKAVDKSARDTFKDARTQMLQTCKGSSDTSTQCTDLRNQAHVEAKVYLETVATSILDALNSAKVKLNANAGLDATVKANAIAAIDARIAATIALKTQIDALSDTPTSDQLRTLAKQLKDEWQQSRNAIRVNMGRFRAKLMGDVLNRANGITGRFSDTVSKLQAKGADTTTIEANIASYNQAIADAQVSQQQATSLFASGDVDGAHAQMTDAMSKLKQARDTLRDIMEGVKQANGGNLGINARSGNRSTDRRNHTNTSDDQ